MVVSQLSGQKSNLFCGHGFTGIFKQHLVLYKTNGASGAACLLVAHVASLKYLLIPHMCQPVCPVSTSSHISI